MYIPKQGDIIWIDFNPQKGHERAGHRPALVVSKDDFNRLTGFALVCPITSQKKDYPLHIELIGCKKVTGCVMLEQIKALDYSSRNAKCADRVSHEYLNDILEHLNSFF
jgi:mRNA interferase MazF